MLIDVTHVVEQYRGMWVAYKDDRKTVVASGKTAKIALKRAKEAGYSKPILARIPSRILNHIGCGTSHNEVRL